MDNPYQSHTSVSYSDKEIRFFRTVLEHYKRYQGRDMPSLDIIRMYAKGWVMSGILVFFFMALLIWLGENDSLAALGFVPFLCGLVLGRVLRDVHHCRASSRLWPIIGDVLDWKRVDQKLEELGPE